MGLLVRLLTVVRQGEDDTAAVRIRETGLRHCGSASTLVEILDRTDGMAWRALHGYWRERHVDGRPPSRADIDPPLEIPRLLPNLLLYDRPERYFRIRLAGSEIVHRGGHEHTGQTLDPDMVSRYSLGTLVDFLNKVAGTLAPVIYSVARSNETAFGAIGILMPLVDRDGAFQMVLGGVFYRANRGGNPRDAWIPGGLSELSLSGMLEQDIEGFR